MPQEKLKEEPKGVVDSAKVLLQIPLVPKKEVKERGRKIKLSQIIWGSLIGLTTYFVMEGYCYFKETDYFEIRELAMKPDDPKVPIERLKEALQPVWSGTYFTADIDKMREAANEIPWVKSAQVQRVWPDKILVKLTLFRAMAQFEDGRLVSDDGFLFSANPEEEKGASESLPIFKCAQNQVAELTRNYKTFSKYVAKLDAQITEISVSDRQSWAFTLSSDKFPPIPVELGQDEDGNLEKKVADIVAAFPSMTELLGGPPQSIDARYEGAFAAEIPDRKALQKYLEEVKKKKGSMALIDDMPEDEGE